MAVPSQAERQSQHKDSEHQRIGSQPCYSPVRLDCSLIGRTLHIVRSPSASAIAKPTGSQLVASLRRRYPQPLPDRDLLIALDEAVLDHQEDGLKLIWVFDNRQADNPISISSFTWGNW